MKKSLLLWLLMISIVIGCSKEASLDEAPTDDVKKVKVMTVDTVKMGKELLVEADLLPSKQAIILAETNGEVKAKPVKIGDEVSEGQVLIELKNDDLMVQYERQQNTSDQLQIQIDKARKDRELAIESAKKAVTEKEITLKGAEQAIEKLKIQQQAIERNLEAMRALYKEGAVSREELNKVADQEKSALLNMEDAKSQVEKAKIALDLAKQQLEQVSMEYDQQLLTKRAEEATLGAKAAKLQLDKTKIEAPFAGVVLDLEVNVGENVSAKEKIATVEQHHPLHVKALLTETDLMAIHGKEEIQVYIPVINKTMSAKIDYLSPSKSEQGFPIRLVLENKEKRLKPGMSGHVVLSNENVKQVIAIPISTIMTEGNESFVFVVNGDVSEKRKVKLGRKNNDDVEVVSGLSKGESIVIVGQGTLNDGDQVHIIE